jgi:hypothetical protein
LKPASVLNQYKRSPSHSAANYVFDNLLIGVFAPVLTAGGLAQELRSPYLGQLVYALILGSAPVASAVLSWHLYEKHFLRLKSVFST